MRNRLIVVALIAAAVIAVAALPGCSDDSSGDGAGGSVTEFDRSPQVAAVIDDIVAPLYRQAGASVDDAVVAVDELCSAPSDVTLAAARTAVATAVIDWERLDTVDMGPIMDNRAQKQVVYTTDAARVDALLAAGPPADAEAAAKETAADARGLGAAAHLLTADLSAFSYPPRCTYLRSVTGAVGELVDAVVADWFDAEPPYVDRAAGRDPDAVPTKEMLDQLVNMAVDTLGADAKLIGDTIADPTTAESVAVREAAAAHVDTISAVWGDQELGLAGLVSSRRADVLTEELAAAKAALAAEPYDPAVAQAALDAARATFATEIVAALDVTLSFSENDGDA